MIQEPDITFLTSRQLLLLDFCIKAHGNQVRKYTGEPYWYHLVNVAKKVPVSYYHNIEVALCHDLFEDTSVKEKELYKFLKSIGYTIGGARYICEGVTALTDVYTTENYPTWNRKLRKVTEIQRLSIIKPDFQTVKYADLIDNTSSIMAYDKDFAKIYIREKYLLLMKMNKGDFDLYLECCALIYNNLSLIK